MPMTTYTGPARGLRPIRIGEHGLTRQHDTTYWYWWGPYNFDIRDLRESLGLPREDTVLDNYFRPEGKQYALRQVHRALALATPPGVTLAEYLHDYLVLELN